MKLAWRHAGKNYRTERQSEINRCKLALIKCISMLPFVRSPFKYMANGVLRSKGLFIFNYMDFWQLQYIGSRCKSQWQKKKKLAKVIFLNLHWLGNMGLQFQIIKLLPSLSVCFKCLMVSRLQSVSKWNILTLLSDEIICFCVVKTWLALPLFYFNWQFFVHSLSTA